MSDAVVSNKFGEFLRAARARLDPADAGIRGYGSRRVSGLRREEVAVLAGVSADYYARLEQGRERNPSAQVVFAIGQALRLDPDAQAHILRLAGLSPSQTPSDSRDQVHPDLLRLLDAFPTAAAYVLGPTFDILATNPVAAALLSPFDGLGNAGLENAGPKNTETKNMVRILFQHPAARSVFAEWPLVAENVVHALRLNAGYPQYTAEITKLVEEVADSSTEFRLFWNDQNVRGLVRAFKVFVHPQVGRIELTYQTFDVLDAPGQQLLVGTPEPNSVKALVSLGAARAERD